jgi:AcrR family transcriptional regulator
LLLDRPFAALTVGDVMARAGLTRTVFYRHFDRLAQMAPELLPDAEDPLLDQLVRGPAEDLITGMVSGLVALYADNGRWLRALDAAAAADPAVSTELDRALVGPRQLLEQLVGTAPNPPANPHEFALLLMATHRAYLLDTFGGGHDSPERRTEATAALTALWERLLAE